MKIILTNGQELQCIQVQGEHRYINGANRDCLKFIFPENASMDELDSIFTEANCETIKLVGDDGVSNAVYTDYAIRVELKQSFETVEPENSNNEEQTVKRIAVSMAQRSYVEKKLAQVADEVTNTQLALVELYEGGIA